MPAIRDYKTASEISTGDAGITIATPSNVSGDLLVAFVMADSFLNGVWYTPSGWTRIAPKYDLSFNSGSDVSSAAETITIVGHGVTTGEPLVYQKRGGTAVIGLTAGAVYYARAIDVDTITLHSSAAGAIGNTLRTNLTSSGTETHYFQGGETLSTCSAACYYKLSSGSEAASFTFGADSGINETYNGCIISISGVDQTTPVPTFNFQLQTVAANATAITMQTITTSGDNSLCLAFVSDNNNIPSFFSEGSAHHLLSLVGLAESMCAGWFVQPTAGLTPAISCHKPATFSTGTKGILEVKAASGVGSPAHVAADTSELISPLHGNAAYASAPALSATAATNFSTSLGGYTSANIWGLTINALSGIFPELSSASLNISANAAVETLFGGELILSSGYNFSAKPLLFHFTPSTPTVLGLTNAIANKGVCVGFRSAANADYKVWAVAGKDTSGLGFTRHLPVVVDPSAGSAFATNGTLNSEAVTGIGFWLSLEKTTSSSMPWLGHAVWALGTVTICGGYSALPITLSDITNVFNGKQSRTVFLQGATQGLFFQPIVLGNGGTNALYCDLDACAIEFPVQHNEATGKAHFNTVDNWVGLKYYAGASDTVKHTNSVVSSPSRFHWGLHASSSASATYNFTRLSIVGAGEIALNKAITIDRLVINDYVTLDISNATLTNCTIAKPPAANDSLATNASTALTGCTIDVSTVSSGNRWCSVADPSIFSSCAFTGGGGHAIRITSPGTYSFTGNTITGFGANGSNGAFFYNDSGGAVTINISGGSTPTYKNGSGASTVVNNASTVTIEANTSLVGAEIRVYDLDDDTPPISYGTELSGVESHNAATYQFSTDATNLVLIQIMKDGYVEFVQSYTVPSGSSTFTALLTRELNA